MSNCNVSGSIVIEKADEVNEYLFVKIWQNCDN